ncbi:MAG: DUF2117 domain-containing protein [Euryarchaeota archaeon]|nr:DUF2117 domain-containing protein [Euryarchaeota archaeon]
MANCRRIKVIVHGPEAVDTGLASEVISIASGMGRVEAAVGGTTAAAAVIDAGLERSIDISSRELPSVAITKASGCWDLVLLVNQGKDLDSSIAFGRLVMSKVAVPIPVVQVESGISILWAGGERDLEELGPLLKGEVLDLRNEARERRSGSRALSGVRPGENVWINGHVIGRAERAEVVIGQSENGSLIAKGVRTKPTGIERLGRFDLSTAIIRSGHVRRTRAEPRSLMSEKSVVCLIDHCAEESLYRCRDAAYVVTVGDDTSKISSALLYRLGIPVIAITDGDEDGISSEELLYPGSYVFRLAPGNDDLVGAEMARSYFSGGHRIKVELDIDEMAARVRAACGERLLWERRF